MKGRSKTALAKELGITRSTLYYKQKKPPEDELIKEMILVLQKKHRAYGHRRFAIELSCNKKKILRIMRKYGIKPLVHRRFPRKPDDEKQLPSLIENIAKTMIISAPNVLWAGDFTYIWYQGRWYYLATVIDVYTREIVGWHISTHHTTSLIIKAFRDAVRRQKTAPLVFHSDQGSEYVSGAYAAILAKHGVKPSHSKKSSPWENGYQESFYNNFKLELGPPDVFAGLGELIEAIHQQIRYYNTERIHTSLRMNPKKFRDRYESEKNKTTTMSAVTLALPLIVQTH